MSDEPEISFSIDLRGVVVKLAVAEDGEPTLTIGDEQCSIALETGAGGSYEDAVHGVARLHERVGQLLAVLRVRTGDRAPFTPLPPIENDGPIEGTQPRPDGDRRIAGAC